MKKITVLFVLLAVLALFSVPGVAQEECSEGFVYDNELEDCVESTGDGSGDSPNSSDNEDGASDGENGETSQNGNETATNQVTANLTVTQPHYVTSGIRQQDDGRTYVASGEVVRINLQGVNESDIIRSGLNVDSGSLKYDKQTGQYILNTDGVSGTYGAYWVESTDDGQVTHRANIKIEEAGYEFVLIDEYERLLERAQFGEFSLDLFDDFCSDVESCETLMDEQVYPWYMFAQNPLTALTGDFLAIGTLLIFRPGGWFIIGLVFLPAAVLVWLARREARTLRRQMAEIGDIDEARKKQYVKEMKQMISMKTWQDYGFSDNHSQFLRKYLGDNPWSGFEQLRQHLTETDIARAILRAHGQLGYSLVENDDGYELVEDAEDGVSPVDVDEDVFLQIDWSQIDGRVLQHEDVDRQALFTDGLAIAPEPTEGDLIDELDISVREDGDPYALVDSREDVARLFADFLTGIASDPDYTDDEGRPRADMDVLNILWLIVDQNATKYGLPIWHTRDLLMAVREELDAGDRLYSKVKDISGGRR
jgi:hypothetical protein